MSTVSTRNPGLAGTGRAPRLRRDALLAVASIAQFMVVLDIKSLLSTSRRPALLDLALPRLVCGEGPEHLAPCLTFGVFGRDLSGQDSRRRTASSR
jgi:hypothetical protein